MREELKRDIANFFYYSLLNEPLALDATSKTYMEITKPLKAAGSGSAADRSRVVHACHLTWEKFHKKARFQTGRGLEADWMVPAGVDVGLWKHYVREADPEEFLAVVYCEILKYEDIDVAKGLGVTVGTVRHRVGRGLRRLGAMLGGDS